MPEKQILDSWKEIAVYLNRTVRTCQRWETEIELPIYRLDGSPKANVFAYKEELDRWLEGTLHTKRPTRGKFNFLQATKFKWIIGSVSLLLLFGLILVISRLVFVPDAAFASFDKPSIAVLYFENSSGDKSLDIWKIGIAELLITDLNQSKFINVISSDRIHSHLKNLSLLNTNRYSTEELMAISEKAAADFVVRGSLLRAGDRIVIVSHMHNPRSDDPVISFRYDCLDEDDILSRVDLLSNSIKEEIIVSPEQIDNDIDENITTVRTESSQAMKYFLTGRQHFRVNNYDEAAISFEKAVAIDSEFAMAYRMLGLSYSNLAAYDSSIGDKARRAYKKTLESSHRLTQRENLLFQADLAAGVDLKKCEELCKELLEIYPDDSSALSVLGRIAGHSIFERMEDAIEWNQRLVEDNYPRSAPYHNLSLSYRKTGQYKKAIQAINSYIRQFGPAGTTHLNQAQNYIAMGDFDQAYDQVQAAFLIQPTNMRIQLHRGDTLMGQGKINLAKLEYQGMIDSENLSTSWWGSGKMANLLLLQGRYQDALGLLLGFEGIIPKSWEREQIEFHQSVADIQYHNWIGPEKALIHLKTAWDYIQEFGAHSIPGGIIILHRKGLTELELGKVDLAAKTAYDMESLVAQGWSQRAIRFLYHLRGRIELKRENFSEAVNLIEKAIDLDPNQSHPQPEFIESQALVYYNMHDFKKALEVYEEIANQTMYSLVYTDVFWLNTSTFFSGDIYAKSFYMLGLINEKLGDKKSAAKYYDTFLTLWEAADPDIEEAQDAKIRLRHLTSS